jgi:hypothetical protein
MHTHRAAALAAIALLLGGTAARASAAEIPFRYKISYRNVTSDPDRIWTGDAFAPGSSGTVTIHEYELRTDHADLLISQIWDADCSSATCPTRLVRLVPHKPPIILVDDMMHQVVPPDDPRFAALAANRTSAAFAQHPFLLGNEGKTLVNGNFTFRIGGERP